MTAYKVIYFKFLIFENLEIISNLFVYVSIRTFLTCMRIFYSNGIRSWKGIEAISSDKMRI